MKSILIAFTVYLISVVIGLYFSLVVSKDNQALLEILSVVVGIVSVFAAWLTYKQLEK